MAEGADLPRREDAEGSLQPAHVPVGLTRSRGHAGAVRAVEEHGIDLGQATERAQHGADEAEQPDRSHRVGRPEPAPGDGAFGPVRAGASAGSGEVGVLLPPEDGQVGGEGGDQDAWDQQHMDDEKPGDDVGPWELASEHQ